MTGPNLWQYGPMSKSTTKRWQELGYGVNCGVINATAVGGAIDQSRLMILQTRLDTGAVWLWHHLDRELSVARPMSNLLTPPGLLPRTNYKSRNTPTSHDDPMPHQVGALIRTEKGVRRLLKEEVAQGLGIPKGSEENLAGPSLQRKTLVFHWEHLSASLQNLFDQQEQQTNLPSTQATNGMARAPPGVEPTAKPTLGSRRTSPLEVNGS